MLFKRSRTAKRQFVIPPGNRVYAIGDVHGRLDLLDRLLDIIGEDDAKRGPATPHLIFLGDLVDRGPQSAEVVEQVRYLCRDIALGRLIKGNHEDVFVRAAKGSPRGARSLIGMDGAATLLSYGLSVEEIERGSFDDLAAMLVERIPREHVDFLAAAEEHIVIGDYLFVHAGIRPGVPIAEQSHADLYWIREPFLNSRIDHGMMVVHGHSVTAEVDERANRIGIDTGAYETGRLTAIGLEDDERWFLSSEDDAGVP